jgi:LCP family protein required for cell wall assembly
MKRWQKIIIGILPSLIALVVAAIIAFIVMVNMGRAALLDKTGLNINPPKQATVEDSGNYIVYKGQKYKYNDNMTSILCMGIDKDSLGSIDGQVGTGGDADSIFLLTMDLETGESTIVNISRDTMAEIGVYAVNGTYVGTKKAQLALAYAYGDGKETSCHNEIVAVRQIFYNLPINSYLSLDLDGIGPINDSIGGVTVVSPETIGDFKAGETYELFGSMATYFVRNRSHATIEGNNLRMQRQKTYLDSFASSLLAKTKENLTAPLGVFDSASPYICTDLNASKVSYLATQAIQSKFKGFEIRTVPGEIKKGKKYAEFYIDEDKFLEMFLDIFYKPVS